MNLSSNLRKYFVCIHDKKTDEHLKKMPPRMFVTCERISHLDTGLLSGRSLLDVELEIPPLKFWFMIMVLHVVLLKKFGKLKKYFIFWIKPINVIIFVTILMSSNMFLVFEFSVSVQNSIKASKNVHWPLFTMFVGRELLLSPKHFHTLIFRNGTNKVTRS